MVLRLRIRQRVPHKFKTRSSRGGEDRNLQSGGWKGICKRVDLWGHSGGGEKKAKGEKNTIKCVSERHVKGSVWKRKNWAAGCEVCIARNRMRKRKQEGQGHAILLLKRGGTDSGPQAAN